MLVRWPGVKNLTRTEAEKLVGHEVLVTMKSGENFRALFSGKSLDIQDLTHGIFRNPRMRHPFKIDTRDADWVSFPYIMIRQIIADDTVESN